MTDSRNGYRAAIAGKFTTMAAALTLALGLTGTCAFAESAGKIVVFMPPGTDNYLAQWQVGAKAKAKDLGYDIKIIESSRDQAEQDSQVQQELASGEEVAGLHLVALRQCGRHWVVAHALADRQAGYLHKPVSNRGNREILDGLRRR